MIYLQLFWSFFQIGLFSFGGGYASIPLIQNQTVSLHHWLTLTEFSDIVTVSQMTPGPVAINTSTFVGTKIAGVGGAAAATIGCITPSCIIVLILAVIYMKYKNLWVMQGMLTGLRPAVVALVAVAGMSILITAFWGENGFVPGFGSVDWAAAVLCVLGVVIMRKFKPNPILVMSGAGVMGLVYYGILGL